MYATHEAELDLPRLPRKARLVKLVPDLSVNILISIGQLCDNDCEALFTKSAVFIYHDGSVILQGTRQGPNSLWTLAPPKTTSPASAFAARPAPLPSTIKPADVVAFLHAALGSPSISTLEQALRRNYIHGFPGLTLRSLQRHPPHSRATFQGHQDSTRQNVQSTRDASTPTPPSPEDSFPKPDNPNERTRFVFPAIKEITGPPTLIKPAPSPFPPAVV
jgi:hypothetical protein